MIIETIKGGMDENLNYVIGCPATRIGAVVDAAVPADEIVRAAEKHDLRLLYLLITHSHRDHLLHGAELLSALNPAPFVIGYGPAISEALDLPPERFHEMSTGDRLLLGHLAFGAFHTPGHCADSLCFYFAQENALFTGDTLFVGRTGRTRFPGQSAAELYRGIRDHIQPLPDDVTIYPGHDYGPKPTDTLGGQRQTNRFLTARDEADFVRIMDEYEASR